MNGFEREQVLKSVGLLQMKDTSDMAYEAAVEALHKLDIKAEEIDMILVATVTPDQPFPSVSCMLQERLGAKKAAAMDISAACAGFMYGMITAKQFIESGAYKHVCCRCRKTFENYRLGRS